MDKYVLTEALGSGAFGTVYKGYRQQDDLPVAVKVINSTSYSWDEIANSREVVALTQCLHPNIVPLVEVVLSRHAALHMVFEYFPTDLLKLLKRSGNNSSPNDDSSDEEPDFGLDGSVFPSAVPLPKAPPATTNAAYPPTAGLSIQRIQHIGVQLLSALSHMHARGFLHRDVKPENVLVRTRHERDHAVLADLGLARQLPTTSTSITTVASSSHDSLGKRASDGADLLTGYVATRWYRAPELLLRCADYDTSVDIWGAACVLAELALGRPLFAGESEEEVLRRAAGTLGTPHDPDVDGTHTADPRTEWRGFHALCAARGLRVGHWPRAGLQPLLRGGDPALCGPLCALLESMLAWDPAQRPSADQCLQHPFFAGVAAVAVPVPSPPLMTNQLSGALPARSVPVHTPDAQSTASVSPRVSPLLAPAEDAALLATHSLPGAPPPPSPPSSPPPSLPVFQARSSTRVHPWRPAHTEDACARARWVSGACDVYACALEEALRSHAQQLWYRRADGREGPWPGLAALTKAVGASARVGPAAHPLTIARGGQQEPAPPFARSRSRPHSRRAFMAASGAPHNPDTHPDTDTNTDTDTASAAELAPPHRRALSSAAEGARDSAEETRDSDDDDDMCVLRGLRCSWPMAEVALVVCAADTCAQQLMAARAQPLQSDGAVAQAVPAPPVADNDTRSPQALPRAATSSRTRVLRVHAPPGPARRPPASPPPPSSSSPEAPQQSVRAAPASIPASACTYPEPATAPSLDGAPPVVAAPLPMPAAPSPTHSPAGTPPHAARGPLRPSSGRLSSTIPLATAASAPAVPALGPAPAHLLPAAHLPLPVPRLFARKAHEQGVLVVPLFKHALKLTPQAHTHGVLSVFFVTADGGPTDLLPLAEQLALLRGAPAAAARVARARLDACLPSPRYATLVLARDGVAAACRARLRPGLDARRCLLKMVSFALAQLQTQTQQQAPPCAAELDAADAQAVCAAMDAWARGVQADGGQYTQPATVAAALLQGALVDAHGVVTDAPPTPTPAEDGTTRRRALQEALAAETDDLDDLGDLLDATVDEDDDRSGVASPATATALAVAAGADADMLVCPSSEPITAHDDDVWLGHRLQRALLQHLLAQPASTPPPAPARPQTPPPPARSLPPEAQPGTPARLAHLLGAQSAALRAQHASAASPPVSAPPAPPTAPPPAAPSCTPTLPPLRRATSPAARPSTPSLLRHLHAPAAPGAATTTDLGAARPHLFASRTTATRAPAPATLPPLRGQPPSLPSSPSPPSSRPQTPLAADAVTADDAPWHGTRTFALPPLAQRSQRAVSQRAAEPLRPSVSVSVSSARPVLGRPAPPPRLPSTLPPLNPLAGLPVRPAPGPGLGRVAPTRAAKAPQLMPPRAQPQPSSTARITHPVAPAPTEPRAPSRAAPRTAPMLRLAPAFLAEAHSAAEDSVAEDSSDDGLSGLSPRDSPRVRTHAYSRLLSGGLRQVPLGPTSRRHVHSRPTAYAGPREAEDDVDVASESGAEFLW